VGVAVCASLGLLRLLPQVMLQNSGNVDNLTGHYVFFLGCGGCGGAVV
jgi:hypothetical protein